jgi:hypothetical protein
VVSVADLALRRLVELIRPCRPQLGARTTVMFEELRAAARAEGIELLRFTYAGSMVHGTGLRHHRDRECSVPGQAADLVVELGPNEVPDYATYLRLAALAERCFAAAGAAAEHDFRRARLCWRLLPILAQRGDQPGEGIPQYWVEPNRRIQTSVGAHSRDVRARTRASTEQVPSVAFNDCVRLLKWWRHARPPDGVEARSFVLERLAIVAYDRLGAREGFAQTLLAWTRLLSEPDARSDLHEQLEPSMIDRWSHAEYSALARWFATGAETLERASTLSDERELSERLALDMFGPIARKLAPGP